MNARREAFERLGGCYEVRVLEPSPPAVDEPPWYADDPLARGQVADGAELVSPVSGGDLSWREVAGDDAELAAWCAERWLGPYRRLPPAASPLAPTSRALHRVAAELLSAARERANGKIALRYTRGGFGTPFFGADVQLRIEGTELVVQRGEAERRAPLTSIDDAAEAIGAELLGPDAARGPERLEIDPEAAALLGEWFGFGASVLEQLRAEATEELAPSRVQLWPEHFDLGLDLGDESRGTRAGYGASPGDAEHVEPYLYVVPFEAPPAGDLWNATAFAGAELPYAALVEVGDQRATALDFFRTRLDGLHNRRAPTV